MTHFIDDSSTVVTSAIDALIRSSGGALTRLDGYPDIKVVRRSRLTPDQVAVISGGGAGHEPAHTGFVGPGLLTAAVSGEIFASPSVEAVLSAIRSVDTGPGCLLIVKNYTGDRLNFGLAAERARAEGHQVEIAFVADDLALESSDQPRGLAGTLFVHRVAGALAAQGSSLLEVARAARGVAASVKTLGVSLSGPDAPGRPSGRDFAPGSAEFGLGIHGEPGVDTIPVEHARGVVALMAERLGAAVTGEAVAVLVNNLGGLSALEMGVIVDDLLATPLGARTEMLVGPAPLMTSVRMRGFSLSVAPADDRLRAAMSAPYDPGSAWPGVRRVGWLAVSPMPSLQKSERAEPSDDPAVRAALVAVSTALVEAKGRLDALDALVGDGDTGSTFAAAGERILAEIDDLPMSDRAALLARLADLASVSMGGSSGVLISIALMAAASAITRGSRMLPALAAGAEAMQEYGGARAGDRTMLDALLPALSAMEQGGDAAEAAAAGAASTAKMERASAGRSAYVPSTHLRGVADPGAEAVATIFAALQSVPRIDLNGQRRRRNAG